MACHKLINQDMLSKRIHKLIKILKTPFYRKTFFRTRVAASVENEDLLRYLKTFGVGCFVDIGSNRGQFALAARHFFPFAHIYCFEPLAEAVRVLRKVFSNDSLVVVHEMAIGDVEGPMTLHVSKMDDSSSLLPISSMQSSLYPGTGEKETRAVQVKPLQDVINVKDIKNPAVLKIDVQGFEGQVLRGSRSLLPYFSYIYAECSFVPLYLGQSLTFDVIDYLEPFGFILSGAYNMSYDKNGIAVQGDFLFSKQKKPVDSPPQKKSTRS
jgi:FkbM family methyltransferase